MGRFELLFEDGSVGFQVGKLERGGERIVDGFVGRKELVAHASRCDEDDGTCATEARNIGSELNTD